VTDSFRCSAASAALSESVAGSASTVRAFLLVEAPGPWGVDAVRDSRLPAEVKQRLRSLANNNRVRPLLIRRHSSRTRNVYASFVHTDRPWVETTTLTDVRELLDVDFTGLGRGESPGLAPYDEQLYLVCTHGKHDACCAERGRPLWQAMHQASPRNAWQVSHIGGDRFAANVLVLPHGLYYGRVAPEDAAGLVAAHEDGRVDLAHLRGRCAFAFSVQAAEIYLRHHLGVTTLEPLALHRHTRQGTETRAVFAAGGTHWLVRVHTDLGERRQLACRATTLSHGPAHRLVAITEVDD
jgi:hypothetical protein